MIINPAKRALSITKSIGWFQQLHGESMVLTNLFDLRFYTHQTGIVVHLIQCLDYSSLSSEFQEQIEKDKKEFVAYFKIFSFVVMTSSKFAMVDVTKVKKRKWTPEQIVFKMDTMLEITDSYGTSIMNFTGGRGRYFGRNEIQEHFLPYEIPSDPELRNALQVIYNFMQ